MSEDRNVILLVIESLGYYRAYMSCLRPEFQLTELFDLAKDGTTFHKCISVSNSSWMSTAAILMGNDVCYQHNISYDWGHKYSQATVKNTWSDSLFGILKRNGYKTASFTSPDIPNETGFRLHLFDLVDEGNKRVDTVFSGEETYFFKDKQTHFQGVIEYIKKNKSNKFSLMSWSYLDHLAICQPDAGFISRLVGLKETMKHVKRIIDTLKAEGLYEKTDIYLIGDHGDTLFYTKDFANERVYQHGTLPFHITTHVPLVVKSPYLAKGNRYDLVANTDLRETILNSLKIYTQGKQKLPKNLSSIDLKGGGRDYVLSRNRFMFQKDNEIFKSGVAITDNNYCYLFTKKKKYLFYHQLDMLNMSNLFDYEENIAGVHRAAWFNAARMKQIKTEIVPHLEMIVKQLMDDNYIQKEFA